MRRDIARILTLIKEKEITEKFEFEAKNKKGKDKK
jgi:hypothetical protein